MIRSIPIALAALGVVALLIIAAMTAMSDDAAAAPSAAPASAPEATDATAEMPQPVVADDATPTAPSGAPAEAEQQLAPGQEIPYTPPKGLTSGILCPDGSYLPLLNGVESANRIQRNRKFGPMGPVIAKRRDPQGREWYVHADGSLTTTVEETIIVEGEPMQNVLTVHLAQGSQELDLPPLNPERAAAQQQLGEPELLK